MKGKGVGKKSRDKGARIEREIVNLHKDHGIDAVRVPMSGASHYTHDADIDVYPVGRSAPLVCEVKARKQFPKWLNEWLGDNDALFLREDNRETLVVMPFRVYIELAGGES